MNTNVSSNHCQTINRAFVLGYPVDLVDMPTAISLMEGFWQSKCGMHVVTLNAEMTMQSINNKELGDIIKKADLIVPDGAGVVLSLKNRGGICAQAGRLPGIELAQKALESAAARGEKVALLGGRPEVMEKLKQILPQKHPGLNVVAYQNGFFKADQEGSVMSALAALKPGLVLVALGVPRQEFVIDKYRQLVPEAVMVGVGGSFDVWTGFVQRAPVSYQKLHLEWLYRLQKEPWRFKRMAGTLPAFALKALFENLTGKYLPAELRSPLKLTENSAAGLDSKNAI